MVLDAKPAIRGMGRANPHFIQRLFCVYLTDLRLIAHTKHELAAQVDGVLLLVVNYYCIVRSGLAIPVSDSYIASVEKCAGVTKQFVFADSRY